MDNLYKYFHVISRSCIFTNTKPCYFQLKEPLTLTGTLTYIIDYSLYYNGAYNESFIYKFGALWL